MEAAPRHSIDELEIVGLHARDSNMSFTSTASSESHAPQRSSTLSDPFRDEYTRGHSTTQEKDINKSSDMLGQFSFAPATQTTVVTTTTTTTTNFPPLMMKAPNHLHELDSKLYPLAASPTPQSIKRFCFDVGGRPTVFREADDAQEAYSKLSEQHMELSRSQGVVRSVVKIPNWETPKGRLPKVVTPTAHRGPLNMGSSFWQPTPPVSICEAAKLASSRPSIRKYHVHSGSVNGYSKHEEGLRPHATSRLQICQTSTPITPSLGSQIDMDGSDEFNSSSATTSGIHPLMRELTTNTPLQARRDTPQTLSPRPELHKDTSFTTDASFSTSSSSDSTEYQSRPTQTRDDLDPGSDNPQLEPPTMLDLQQPTVPTFRPRPAVLNTTAAQDMSLPSPSLSPVTAAANLQNRMGYFDDSGPARSSRRPALSSPPQEFPDEDEQTFRSALASRPWTSLNFQDRDPSSGGLLTVSPPSSVPSMMEIPTILDSFDAMPAEMKYYVMYQLLRRCPKPVLQFVANVVNPALKCDFLNLLPPELCQTVVGYLDLQSLCHAAQVSKKWRQVIDSDEQTWKKLFYAEGFEVPNGELQRAIWEGWGWQFASGANDWEKDIGDMDHIRRRTNWDTVAKMDIAPIAATNSEPQLQQTGQSKRSKRKAASKSKVTSRKQQKKKDSEENTVAQFDCEAFIKHISNSDGPYAAAQAAAFAVPVSEIGLPSLRSLHLYKSLYRRHHLISLNWMQDEIKPRHLAFKAHQRHVVTCLQFDNDKILTGSDDTNINVYDTRTGALRARLEGHEGGVWALQYEGNTLVSGSTDRSVRVWDIERGICTHVFQGHTSTVRCLVVLMPTEVGKTPSGTPIMMPKEPLIITGSRDSSLRIWTLPKPEDPSYIQTGQVQDEAACPYFVRALTGHQHSVRAIAAHADTLVSGSYDCSVRVWKISTGETVHRLIGHAQKVYSVVLDPERNRCISGSMDNLVKIWSLDTGAMLHNLDGHSSLVGLLDLQRSHLVSAAADSTLRVWDPETGQCKSTLRAHTGAITCFQHDSRKVISGSDRTLKMWDVKTGEFVRDLLTDLSGVWQVKFDERRCVAAVQRKQLTYIEVLDFGASRDGVPELNRGNRIVVDTDGLEINESRDAGAATEE